MRIYLVRHGDAVPEEDAGSDRDRWLSPRGREAARDPRPAACASRRVEPDAIVCSPLPRAVQTAELLAASARLPRRTIASLALPRAVRAAAGRRERRSRRAGASVHRRRSRAVDLGARRVPARPAVVPAVPHRAVLRDRGRQADVHRARRYRSGPGVLRRMRSLLLLLVLLVVVACGGSPKHVTDSGGDDHGDPFVDRESKPRSFTVAVHGKGRPVIFIPGLGCPGDMWDATVEHLSGVQSHVLTLAGFAGTKPVKPPLAATVRKELVHYIRLASPRPPDRDRPLDGWLHRVLARGDRARSDRRRDGRRCRPVARRQRSRDGEVPAQHVGAGRRRRAARAGQERVLEHDDRSEADRALPRGDREVRSPDDGRRDLRARHDRASATRSPTSPRRCYSCSPTAATSRCTRSRPPPCRTTRSSCCRTRGTSCSSTIRPAGTR